MKRKLSMLLAALTVFLLVPLGGAKTAQAAADYSNVRVLLSIGSGVQSFGMSVSGSYFIQENGASFKGGTLTAQYSGGRVVLTHSTAGQIYSGSSVSIMREKIDPSAGYIRATVNGATRNFLGHFTIKSSGSGLRVINTVPLPHYLYGVVRGEMGNAFPLEALKAQAIAAKSYVLSGLVSGSDYDIGDTAADQVYKGYDASESAVINAVNATYDIGLYLGNTLLRAYYAASNGGSTLLPSDVWGGTDRYVWDKAYARTNDPYDVSNPLTPQETISLPFDGDRSLASGVSSRLRSAITSSMVSGGYISGSDSVKAINQIQSFEKISTYTAYITVNITLASGSSTTVKCGIDMRDLMSNAVRKSMRLFVVTETRNGYSLYQGRYGHGVGMSQRGAEQMANQGMKYDKILSFYYPGATLRSMGISAPTDPANPGGSGTSSSSLGEVIATGVTTGGVTFRQGPATTTSALGTVPKGTSLNIYAQESGFSLTQYNGKTGYVSNSYLTITPVTSTTPAQDDTGTALGAGAKAKVTASPHAVMRAKASSSGTIVAHVLTNVVVDLLSESGSYYYAHVQGYQGYILKSEVTVTNAGSTGSSSSGASSSGGAVTAYGETTGNVNFRKGPNTSSSIIKLLSKGTKFDIYSKSNGWYFVSVNGTEGYISATYAKETGKASGGSSDSATGADTGTSGASKVTAYGETTGSVNFRKGPNTSSAIIKLLSKGTKFDIYSLSNGWYFVNVNGTQGYLSASYVKQTAKADSSGSNTNSSQTASYTGVVVNDWVWLRSTPEAVDSGNTIRQCAVGTTVTVYSQTGNFYKVNANGTDGYIHKDFLRVTDTSANISASGGGGTAGTSGVTTASVRLRSSADAKSTTNIITVLSSGTTLTIHGDNGHGWYEVTANGKRGFVSASYVKLT